jgi:pyruvate/2-oxoacid:ferredoxin oxidoreductase beta subunit
MSGVSAYFRKIGQKATCVAFCGDGLTCDVGFQPLSGAAERGENIIYICYDNEGYMNTGIQRSSTTPLSAWTTTTPLGKAASEGKTMSAKNVPLIMAFHLIAYTATATLSHLDDFAKKLTRAKSVTEGMSYIHVLSPCPTGWGAPPEKSIDMCRMAVETNYFPLWEAEKGKFRLTYEVPNPKSIKEFTRMMKRFGHLADDDLKRLQKELNLRFNLIKGLISIKFDAET